MAIGNSEMALVCTADGLPLFPGCIGNFPGSAAGGTSRVRGDSVMVLAATAGGLPTFLGCIGDSAGWTAKDASAM